MAIEPCVDLDSFGERSRNLTDGRTVGKPRTNGGATIEIAGADDLEEASRLEDHELAAQACLGREGAFREILQRYEAPVFSLVVRMVRDRELAEDISQEAFLRAFQAIKSFDPSYKFSSWLFKIANNLTIDHLRRRKLDTVSIHGSSYATTAAEAEETKITIESKGENPEEYTASRELGSEIEKAIACLRPQYRTAVLLRHVEGFSYEEIAEVMELPLGTVKTYIHRGRSELKELLSKVVG